MNFADEATMLVGLILVLGLAYMGVTFWSKKSGSSSGGGGILGGLSGGADTSAGPGGPATNAVADMALDELKDKQPADQTVDRATELRNRFKLEGKDAEVAAKVLKRMLNQDGDQNNA